MAEHEEPDGEPQAQPDWQQARERLMAATGADRLILLAGIVFIVSSFLPWYGLDLGVFGGVNASGWNSGGLAVLAIILGILTTVFAAARVVGQPIGGPNAGQIYLALGGATFIFVLLKLLVDSSFLKFGIFLALASSAALAVGGFQKFQSSAR